MYYMSYVVPTQTPASATLLIHYADILAYGSAG